MSFPMVALGEVIKHRNQFIQIDDIQNYKRCRVRLHAQGIVLRDIVLGAEIKTKKQQVCQTGEFLVAEIDAKIGGFGIVPPELHDSIVSSHYFLFVIDETRLDRRFLDFFIRTPYFREQVTAQGTTNYAAIRPANVLGYKIPFLPLPEQRRIVALIEELAAKIEEARGLRKKAGEEAVAILPSALDSIFERNGAEKWPRNKLIDEKLAFVVAGQHIMAGEYNSSGDGIPYLTGPADFGPKVPEIRHWTLTPKSTSLPGDILLTVKGAGVGKINLAPDVESAMGRQLMAIRSNPDKLLLEFVYYFLNHRFKHFQSIATATTVPGFKKNDVEELVVPVPPLPEQRRIVAYLDSLQAKVDALRRLQAETNAELDALMPAVLDRAFKGEM